MLICVKFYDGKNYFIICVLNTSKKSEVRYKKKQLFNLELLNLKHEKEYKIFGSFDENAKNLRRAFLKAPVKFSRISSRYNLRRRIAYYGNRIRPHKGTDFAASVGTPIMATASGKVIKAS